MASEHAFSEHLARVRAEVDGRLAPWLDARVVQAGERGAEVATVADALRSLVLRGGKRLRAGLLGAAFEGCGGGASAQVAAAGAALELLQAYLLVHDDWMDGDAVRRGGPSVPAMMHDRFPHQAEAMSVLAGDLASAWSREALLELELPAERVRAAAREMATVEADVIAGQILDVQSAARDARDVEAVHALKTASYTVRAPVVMGARLAGAGDVQAAVLAAFARPLGVAFQLRDDVLGTFGDERATGKPAGGDLVAGKRTALVVDACTDPAAAAALGRVLGKRDATAKDRAAALAAVEASGARERVEGRIAALVHEARAALDRAELTPQGRTLLDGAITALTERER
jgi:geranylgeranyl diphosphate synthase type I